MSLDGAVKRRGSDKEESGDGMCAIVRYLRRGESELDILRLDRGMSYQRNWNNGIIGMEGQTVAPVKQYY